MLSFFRLLQRLIVIAASLLATTQVVAQSTVQWNPYTIDWYCSQQQNGDTLCTLIAFGDQPAGFNCPGDASGYYRILKGRTLGQGLPLMIAPVKLPCTCVPPQYMQCTASDLVRLAPGITPVIDPAGASTSMNIYSGTAGPLFDLDGDGSLSANKEGLMLLRFLLGFKPAAVTAGITFTNGRTASAAYDQLKLGSWMGWFQFINPTQYPVPLREGLLFQRCLAGLRGAQLVQGVSGADATTATSQCLKLVSIE